MRVLVVLVAALLAMSTPTYADVNLGDTGQDVTEVQYQLRALGYTLAVDGHFGPQTDRAVRRWQKSNGLAVDGIVGPATTASLARAVRLQQPSAPTLEPTGVLGLPFAPEGLSACDEARFYREQFGLPPAFDGLVNRESKCLNTVTSRTGCCVGYLQIHYIVFSDHRMGALAEICGATWQNIKGNDPLSKQRNMCAAKQLFDVVRYQPWSL